jgi:endo-1,4-beta-xylanase
LPSPAATPSIESRPALRDIAAAHEFIYGAAVANAYLERDPDFAAIYVQECGMLVPEWEANWATVQPQQGLFVFSSPNRLAVFAHDHGLAFRGHILVWHLFNPDWLPRALKTDNPGNVIEVHVHRVVEQYRGVAWAWDVVNEAVEPKDGRADGLRRTLWLDALGPGYIDHAFHVARAADPAAKLIYNDYGLDHADFESQRKRRAVLDLLRDLKTRGVPVDALGMQAHLWAGRPFDGAGLRRFIRDVAELGLEVHITELDVTDKLLPDDGSRDVLVARLVADYLGAALAEPSVKCLITWGLSDRYSWLNTPVAAFARRADDRPVRGLPLDLTYHRKPMWAAIADALEARRSVG